MRGANSILTYNGELFGTEEVAEALRVRGSCPRGTSDTELLLRALEAWGLPEALERVRGQFAFLWWHEQSRRLFMGRDRFGIRPLYYAVSEGRFAAASEQKALLLLPWVDPTPSRSAALRFVLTRRTDDLAGETMVEGLRALPPGHWGCWDGHDLRLERYYRLAVSVPRTDAVSVRAELERAVAEQLVSEVPIGAMVSGGLDSSAVVLLADRIRCDRLDSSVLHLFPYHDALAEADERPYQDAVLARIRSPHQTHWTSSTPETLAGNFDRYVDHQEEPFGDVSSFAEYSIAESAADKSVKVLLGGLGGDEVFAGYPSLVGPLLLDALRAADWEAAVQLVRTTSHVVGRAGHGWLPVVAGAYYALPPRVRSLLTAVRAARRAQLSLANSLAVVGEAWGRSHVSDGPGWTNASQRAMLESTCIPRLLAHSDRMCLAHGVESRVPLLDEGVVAAAFGCPPPSRVGQHGLKNALRDALADLLPPTVRERAWKVGFHAPVAAYVRALEAPLRVGLAAARGVLGSAPDWQDLSEPDRWTWGNLGSYIGWVGRQRAARLY